MLKNISIAKKLLVLFAAITTISVASVGVMSYVQMSNTIESDAIAKVVAVEESMGQALDKQLKLNDADLRVLGNYNLTRDALVRFWRAHDDGQRIQGPRWRTGFGIYSPL